MSKYEMPAWMAGHLAQRQYSRWLARKAAAVLRRDRRRAGSISTLAAYKAAIHKAVLASGGKDAYTGESLNWRLVSKYDNAKSKAAGRKYKRGFALLPTVDHVGDGRGRPQFRICSWRVNDAKNDLPCGEFVKLCRAVVALAEERIQSM